jgi:hypothetical protein
MDILSYAAIRRNANLSNVIATTAALTPRVSQVNINNLAVGGLCSTGPNVVPGNYLEDPLYSVLCAMECLDSLSMKRRIPTACGIKVVDPVAARCGFCCAWTVPAGATCIQFQIWGSGGGTSGQCCCGGSPFGPTGAYATVTIPAVPGCVYTLCAACATCCYASEAAAGQGNASFVTGFGLTNFCACGGVSTVSNATGNGCSVCWISNWPTPPIAGTWGASSCSGWNFCLDGTSDGISREYEYSASMPFSGTANSGAIVYGFRGMNPRLCVPSGQLLSITTQSAPIVGFLNSSRHLVSWACLESPGNCGGCAGGVTFGLCGGVNLVPGQGGWPTMACGGQNGATFVGDSGRGGMVCVSWC